MSSPAERARERGITEILHFTTDKGVLGSLRKGQLLSRKQVEDDPDLAFIFLGVWPVKVPEWVDHISLSLSQINRELFERAEQNLPDRWWAVMSFDVAILDEPDVWFTTTNNSYTEVCRRGQSIEGFEDMFAEHVPWGYYGSVVHRRADYPDNLPTHRQAEVLFPEAIDLEHLLRIYVELPEQRRMIKAWCSAFDRSEPTIEVQPEIFR